MTTRSLPALGFDPTPGDVFASRDVARLLGTMSTELGSILSDVDGANCGSWKGKSADAFIDHLNHDLRPAIQKCHDSFDQASSLIYRWAGQLDGFQSEAAALEREAETKQGAVNAARSTVNGPVGVQQPAPPAGSPEAAQKAAQDAKNQKALTDARDAMSDVLRRANDLHDRFIKAAKAIADQLHHAGQMAPGKPGLFDSICNDIGGTFSGAWHWVEQHANAIKFVGDILSDVSAVLGIIAIFTAPFEPIGAIFAAASAGVSVLALGTHLLAMAAGANVSLMNLGADIMGAIPGISALGDTAKVADGATALTRADELGDSLGKVFVPGVDRAARSFYAVGKAAGNVANPALAFTVFGKDVALWGTKAAGTIMHDGSFISRAQMIIESKYAGGQLLGTKALNWFLEDGAKGTIAPLNWAGRLIDGGVKILPKVYFMPHGLNKDLKLGDPFHAIFG